MNLVVSFELNGVHYWPDAPEECREFREPHRHLFKFVFWLPVTTSRSVELFNAREFLIANILTVYPPSDLLAGGANFGESSCEMLAEEMKEAVQAAKVFVGEEWWLGAEV